jgi:hypothetical protein
MGCGHLSTSLHLMETASNSERYIIIISCCIALGGGETGGGGRPGLGGIKFRQVRYNNIVLHPTGGCGGRGDRGGQ